MKKRERLEWILLLIIFLISFLPSSDASDNSLQKLAGHVKKIPPHVTAGILVLDGDTGQIVFEKNKNALLCPASLTKILTTAASLHYLGPDYRFKTKIFHTGDYSEGIIHGDLFIKGYGDPVLVEERVWQAVEALKRKGLKKVLGKVCYDTTFFDTVSINPFWKNVSRKSYFAPSGALSVNFNTTRQGNDYIAVQDPGSRAASLFQRLLQEGGISISEQPVQATVPAGASLLLEMESKALSLIIGDLNRYSNNFIAEQLVKTIAAEKAAPPGTTETGLALLGLYLFQTFGIKVEAYTLRDGSGLAYDNRLSPNQIVTVLRHCAADFTIGPEFLTSLKRPAYDSKEGTFFKSPALTKTIRVKTGHLKGVNGLAGFLHTAEGRTLCFCILLNYRKGNSWNMDRFIEDFLLILTAL